MQLCTYNSAYITHVSVFQIWQTDLEQIRSRINNNLIAGRFGPIGLCQLRTRVLYCNQVVINSATYLLKISSPHQQRSNEPLRHYCFRFVGTLRDVGSSS